MAWFEYNQGKITSNKKKPNKKGVKFRNSFSLLFKTDLYRLLK